MRRGHTVFMSSALALVLFAVGCAEDSNPADGGFDASVDSGPGDAGDGSYVYTDIPFPQWLKEEFTNASGTLPWDDIRAFAFDGKGTLWAGGSGGVMYYTNNKWTQDPLSTAVNSLTARDGVLFAADATKVYKRTAAGSWDTILEVENIVSVSLAGTDVVIIEKRGIGLLSEAGYTLSYSDTSLGGRLAALAGGSIYVATDHGVDRFIKAGPALSLEKTFTVADGLPSDDVRAMAVDSSGRPWFGTAAGLAFLEEDNATISGVDGLPYDDITDILFVDADSALISTKIGAVNYYLNADKFRYFHDRYWLPENEVRASVQGPDWSIYFATAGGISRVYPQYMTLAEKAVHYDQINRTRHDRMGYFTGCALKAPGDLSKPINYDDDNDGQWTGMYLGAISFEYAVGGDPVVRGWAQESMRAMLKLESVTEIPGLFARSIVDGADCPAKQKGGGEWHPTSDGKWCWKGNTSSDEFVGHIFGLSLYYDLVADETEKKDIAADVGRILTRIIDYGYVIADVDGQATEDGHFDPPFMESVGLFGDAGLNSAMILGGLLAGYHMTGDPKFMDSFNYLAKTKGYKEYVRDLQEIGERVHINHDSHEMAFLAFYSLIRYENDPKMKAIWIEGIQKLWETQRPERNPEFNYIYAAMTGASDYAREQSIDTLKRIPWELIIWSSKNSHRKDITIDPKPDRQGREQSTVVLPYDERHIMKWNDNPYALDHEAQGYSEESATYWLLPYWMARYHGLISAPVVETARE